MRNLVNLNGVEKGYGSQSVLRQITLGVNDGDRVGIVGRNGDGKSTLLQLVAGDETPDEDCSRARETWNWHTSHRATSSVGTQRS